MYERCLNEAERILASSSEIVLPIKQVWKRLADDGRRRSFDVPVLTDFNVLLEGDKRFEIISAETDPDDMESLLSEDGEEIDANLGSLGFYPEDRVKLRRMKLPKRPATSGDEGQESEDDEDIVPLNVRGLSATKPVRAVDAKKNVTKKNPAKASTKRRTSQKSQSTKRPKSKKDSRKPASKPAHKSRS